MKFYFKTYAIYFSKSNYKVVQNHHITHGYKEKLINIFDVSWNGLAKSKNGPSSTKQKLPKTITLLVLKCLPSLQNTLDWSKICSTKIRLDLESNPTTFIETQHDMNKKFQSFNVAKKQHSAQIGVKCTYQSYSY